MQKIAVFPGSFDPITIGHIDIINRALPLFDHIVIAIGINTQKKYLFTLEDRLEIIRNSFEHEAKISVVTYDGLTVKFCESISAQYLLRGVRSNGDFEFERNIAQLNQALSPKIETVLFVSKPELSHISSTIVREIIVNHGDVKSFVPQAVLNKTNTTKN
ncbi:MAG: pantetheine-phosphate adenylyltransferase [Sphingobacteriales bacterium]|nr:MAG: pantetheine-phosphate adenylyltransferase [Sphingobacteriales bacterium]